MKLKLCDACSEKIEGYPYGKLSCVDGKWETKTTYHLCPRCMEEFQTLIRNHGSSDKAVHV